MAQPYERASKALSIKKIIFNNLIGGISWGIGATVGVSLFFAILTIITKTINFDLMPVVGSFVSQVVNFVISQRPNH